MKKKIKLYLKKVFSASGYRIIKSKHYNKLVEKKSTNNISQAYSKNSLLEAFFILLIQQNFSPNVIYDIGANKGTWTKECLKFFPKSIYYLFEPQIELKKDIDTLLNGCDNITLFSVGLGKENTLANFTIHERDDGCSFSFSEEEAKTKGFKQIKLPIFRLETFIKDKNLLPPDILKIDAEGWDIEVLEGAEEFLDNVQIIMLEVAIVNDRMPNTALKVLNYLDAKGFKLFDVTDLNRPFANRVLWLSELVFIKKGGILDKNYR